MNITPFQYLNSLQQLQESLEYLYDNPSSDEARSDIENDIHQLHLIKQDNFKLFNKVMSDEKFIFSPHDGVIHQFKFHKNGLLSLKISTFMYSKETNQEENEYQFFNINMQLKKIPEGGILLHRGNTILDLLFDEHEFAVKFINNKNQFTYHIESFDISDIDVSKAERLSFDKFIPKEFKKIKYQK